MAAPLFGVFFVGQSFPITSANFVAVDPTHFVLDCSSIVPDFRDLKEVSLFLCAPGLLDPSLALGLYVKCGGGEWAYRGCVHNGHPSEVMPLEWPEATPAMPVQLGISVEAGADLLGKEGRKLGAKADFAKLVATDLFRFLESFQTQSMGDFIAVPANALDRWFQRFTEKFRKDPNFLTRRDESY